MMSLPLVPYLYRYGPKHEMCKDNETASKIEADVALKREVCDLESSQLCLSCFSIVIFQATWTSVEDDSKARLPPPTTKDDAIKQSFLERDTPITVVSQNLHIILFHPKKEIQLEMLHIPPACDKRPSRNEVTKVLSLFSICCCGSNRTHTHCNNADCYMT
jgi:hypothetical protein